MALGDEEVARAREYFDDGDEDDDDAAVAAVAPAVPLEFLFLLLSPALPR